MELQIDRLVGPTHHFGGLGVGNLASIASHGQVSRPAAAALQGLDKARLVASLGVPQFLLPPQPRPDVRFLRALGFDDSNDLDVLKRALDEAPDLLSAALSSSAMWMANAATATPGVDGGQQRTRITIANLCASAHRAIEASRTHAELTEWLSPVCDVFPPLPGGAAISDEGAANHLRLGTPTNRPGINVLVYGDRQSTPVSFRPRQSRAASAAVARLHRLPRETTFLFQQHRQAIDAGAFHNDVVAMSHHDLFIHHARAFDVSESDLRRLECQFEQTTGTPLRRIEVAERELSLDDAVATYLFNSQIVSPPDARRPVIICPQQVFQHAQAKALVDRWCREGFFSRVECVDLGESMAGGGGPACLRLRVPVVAAAADRIRTGRWSEPLDEQLREVIHAHYPRSVTLSDLVRPDLHAQARHAFAQVRAVCRNEIDHR